MSKKSRDVWAVMHARWEAQGQMTVGGKPTAPTVAKRTEPDPCEGCRNLKGNTCGGVKLPPRAEREGCVIRYW